jgi:hypothetical protein
MKSLLITALLMAALAPPAAQAQVRKGLQGWRTIERVLRSPRCMNCHPRSDVPTQFDAESPHFLGVVRGPHDHGAAGMHCSMCHQARNQEIANIPGAADWSVAPRSMGWQGLGSAALCRVLVDRKANGGRSPAALREHMTTHSLVLWAWNPGAGRKPPDVTRAQLKTALDAWVAAGAPCPKGA